jgi:hypothetical protein
LLVGRPARTSGYRAFVPNVSVMRLQRRLPVVVFVLLLVLCLLLLGLACACVSDHPGQAIERALSSIPAAPPLVELWGAFMLSGFASLGLLRQWAVRVGRASPADLQRFLF